MNLAGTEEAVLSREELDALLEEMPKLSGEAGAEARGPRSRVVDVDLRRANDAFAAEQGRVLSNRHQRVIAFSLIGQRDLDVPELAELMLPTDLSVSFRIQPAGIEGFILLSRPFFFQLLSMSFGAGPAIKPTRPPTRPYTRLEQRFYERATREMLGQLETAWSGVAPLELEWLGLCGRASVAEAEPTEGVLASFDVKGFSEVCRVRVVIPMAAFAGRESSPGAARVRGAAGPEISVLEVPLELRARVGTADVSLAELGSLEPGRLIPLDTPGDGSLTIRIGGRDKFRAIAGTQGSRRAVQLSERLGEGE